MIEPSHPFLLFHPKFVCKFGTEWWEGELYQNVYELGWYRENCWAIDVGCRRFQLLDVVNLGRSWSIFNFPWFGKNPVIKVKYVFGPPEQLSFDQARDIFVEYCCDRRWWSASYETEKQFRERNEKYGNMGELINPVSLKGHWPTVKRRRRLGRK
ncbi:MAG: hypothetical protein IPN84_16375 [Sphingomonadales bacterium]|jgi:hypothetical protein|nr:hypothetical protein [Sphingomonadales bacterium]